MTTPAENVRADAERERRARQARGAAMTPEQAAELRRHVATVRVRGAQLVDEVRRLLPDRSPSLAAAARDVRVWLSDLRIAVSGDIAVDDVLSLAGRIASRVADLADAAGDAVQAAAGVEAADRVRDAGSETVEALAGIDEMLR